MKKIINILFCFCIVSEAFSQVTIESIEDPHIRAQADRMVFQSWGDFKPEPKKILGVNINYHYTATWGWAAPNQNARYRRGRDIRPLGPIGHQTQRMVMDFSYNSSSNDFRKQGEEIGRTAVSELYYYSGLFSEVDPLWQLYYKKTLKRLLEFPNDDWAQFSNNNNVVARYLHTTGVSAWYQDEMERLQERLKGTFKADQDRGSRILNYHRIMKEYQSIEAQWLQHLTWAETAMKAKGSQLQMKNGGGLQNETWNYNNDSAIMRAVIKRAQKY